MTKVKTMPYYWCEEEAQRPGLSFYAQQVPTEKQQWDVRWIGEAMALADVLTFLKEHDDATGKRVFLWRNPHGVTGKYKCYVVRTRQIEPELYSIQTRLIGQ